MSFLIRLVILLRHENLNNNRENFIFEATSLSRDEAANLWDYQIFNSWGEACTLQIHAQILNTDIITISKDSCSVQTFKGTDLCHEPQGKSEDIPSLVDSDEEIDSCDDIEDEYEEHNYDNLKQDHNKK